MARKINLCTEIITVDPEVYGTNSVAQRYDCVKTGVYVKACRYYEPMKTTGGEICPYECEYFNNGCTCVKARKAAHRRAEKILRKLLENTGK